ncbi:MAG: hypothetical protein JXB15_14260 [Anaerolineales bacterium]|nr:hypothetical protein [Anaerolineales bacterium]
MADIRCPLCGKLNPDDLDVCRFCQARLKPFWVGSAPDEGNISPGASSPADRADESATNLPDWLQSLRQSEQQDSDEKAEESNVPDWLTGLRSDSLQDDRFGPEETQEASQDESPSAEQDWMGRLGGETQAAAESADIPGWLHSMEAKSPDAGEPVTPEWYLHEAVDHTPPEEAVPDWLSPASTLPEEQPSTVEEPAEGELPDWLSPAAVDATPPSTPEGEPPEVELPRWLSTASTGAEPAPVPEGEIPDEGLPDWLSSAAPTVSSPTEPTQEPEETQLPNWLSGLEQELPDWLSGAEVAEPPVPMPEAGEILAPLPESAAPVEITPAGDEMPDWLADFQSTTEPAPQAAEEIEEIDWAAALSEPVLSSQAEPSQPEAEASIGQAESAEADLDWLRDLEASFPEIPVEAAGQGAAVSVAPILPFAPEQPGQTPVEAFESEGLPGWLSEVAPEQEIAQPQEEADLAPASLPSWLEAMRPVETVGASAGETDELAAPVVGAGPLTGLRGVLPAEPDISYIRKPPAYSVKLQLTDAQRTQVELLEQLVKAEGEPLPVPGRAIISSQNIFRIAISLILILSILWPLISGTSKPPEVFPDVETLASSQLISNLAPGSPVLLAVDYEPGLSGEMDAISGAVVDYLMIKGVYLVLISTTATGPVQGEHLLSAVNLAGGHQYRAPDQYINLGFIPGGPAGLLGFAQNPRGIAPSTIEGEAAWDLLFLQKVESVAGFNLVIVATDKTDTARAWIEQVQPHLAATPMLMVVSAQIEPIVRPYYQSSAGQVQGLVAGLAGGATFQSALGRSGEAAGYWSSFQAGILVATLLILVGGIVYVGLFLFRSEKDGAKREVKT